MRKILILSIGILILIGIGLSVANEQIQKREKSERSASITVEQVPKCLDGLYPPAAEQPVYLFRMLGLNAPFSGLLVNFQENDLDNALKHFERFKKEYGEVSKLVPEWEKYYPAAPVEELGGALKAGDPEKVMAAYQTVGQVCHHCHTATMSEVKYRYHWGNFHATKMKDPLTGEQVDYQRMMQYLELNFTGIITDAEEQQNENALKHLRDFRTRLDALGETCMSCHDSERKYYVDKEVQAMLDTLGQALSSTPVNLERIGTLHQGIGMENCFKCHLVHFPAAFAQSRSRH